MNCNTQICKCGDFSGVFFGQENCIAPVGFTRRLAFMPLLDAAGNRNFIDFGNGGTIATMDDTFFDNLTRVVSNDKKLYISPRIENPEYAPQDDDVEEFDSGRKIVLGQNGTEWTVLLVGDDASFGSLSQAKNLKCGQWGMFEIDSYGNLIGDASQSSAFKLYPIPLDGLQINFERKKKTASQRITIKFNIDSDYEEANTYFIPCSLMSVNLVTLPAIQLLSMKKTTGTSDTTTAIHVTLMTNIPANLGQTPIVGLSHTDFTATKEDGTSATIASVTENPDGVYVLNGTYVSGEDTTINLNYKGHVAPPLVAPIP